MKSAVVIFFIIISHYSFCQSKIIVDRNNELNKEALKTENGVLITEHLYQDIKVYDDHFLLIDTIVTHKKKPTVYKGVSLTNESGKIVQSFKEVLSIRNEFLIIKNDKLLNCYSINLQKNILENCTEISEIKIDNKDYIKYKSTSNSGVLDYNGKIIIQENTVKNIRVEKGYFIVGDKIKSIYTPKGEELLSKIKTTNFVNINYGKEVYGICTFHTGKQALIGNNKVYFSDLDGEIRTNFHDVNRLVYSNNDGLFVCDSLGQALNQMPFQYIDFLTSNKSLGSVNPVKQDNKWFFVDYDLKMTSDKKFDVIEPVYADENTVFATKKGKNDKFYQVYDQSGQIIPTNGVESVNLMGNYEFFIIFKKKEAYAVLLGSDSITKFEYTTPKSLNSADLPMLTAKNYNGESVLFSPYDSYEPLYTGLGLTSIELVNFIDYFDEPLCKLYKGDKFCLSHDYFNAIRDSIALRFEYDDIKYDDGVMDSHEQFLASKNGLWGLVDVYTGYAKSEFKYDKIEFDDRFYLDDYVLAVYKDKKIGLLGYNGRKHIEIFPPIYNEIEVDDEFYILKKDNKYAAAYYNQPPTDFIFTEKPTASALWGWDGNNEMIEGIMNGKSCECMIMNGSGRLKGNIRCYEKFERTTWGGGDFYYYYEGNKVGLLNYNLDTTLIANFDHISLHANEDYLLTTKDGKKGVRTLNGKIVIPEKYNELIQDTQNYSEITLVKLGDKWGAFYGKTQKLELVYSELKHYESYILANKDGKWGVIDDSFNTIIDFKYKNSKEAIAALSEY